MTRGIGLVLAALAALLVAAAPAGAVRTEVAHAPAGTVDLAGDSVVFSSFAGGTTRIVRAAPGGQLTTLRELQEVSGGARDDDECCQSFLSHGFAASPTRVAVSRFFEAYVKGFLADSTFRLEAGPLGGELRLLFDCRENHPYDVDGDRIAYLGDGCTERDGGGTRMIVRDLAAEGAPVVRSFTVAERSFVGRVDLAGEHVAYNVSQGPRPGIAVHDLVANAEAYRVPGAYSGFSLQPDGKLAVAYSQAFDDCRVDWYSKAEPTAHRVGVCPLGPVRLESDRIALGRRDGDATSLDLVTLGGERRTATLFDPAGAHGGFDWDGARLAYVVEGCVEADDRVVVEDLASDPPVVEGGECPATLGPRTVRPDRRGLLRVQVGCPAGCSGQLNLYSGRSQVNTRSPQVELTEGRTRSVPIRLQGGVLRQLRARGGRVLEARLGVIQRSGQERLYRRPVRVLPPKR